MTVFSEYSLWFTPLCLAIGIAIAFFLYKNDHKLHDAPRWVQRLLFALRAFVVSFLLFLLIAPGLELWKRTIEKPTIVLLHDNSKSIVLTKDSSTYKTDYIAKYQDFTNKLQDNYDIAQYTFGEAIEAAKDISFTEDGTNISAALQDIATRYYQQNLGAIILATDGIYNAGENPKYATTSLTTTPIYTIALGDTTQGCDNVITSVLHNKIAFRDNPFLLRISIESHTLKGIKSTITVSENETVLFKTTITPNTEHYFTSIDCSLTSKEVGKKKYTVQIEHHNQEINAENNTFVCAVDVLESKQKIAIVYESVHPDIAAIHRAIASNKNYECDVINLSDKKDFVLQNYNCCVLVGLPSAYGKGKDIVADAIQANIPCLLLYNQSTELATVQAQNIGVRISNNTKTFDESKPTYNSDFSLFILDENCKNLLSQVPPLLVPFGSYSTSEQTKVLCSQTIGDIETERPLIAFSMCNNVKVGLILGEGLWRWRLFDHKTNGSFEAFDALINKIVAYLAIAERKELFSVNCESVFTENQDIECTAELYDKTFEPVPDQSISFVITNENGKEFPFTFSPNNQFYQLSAGKFPEGTYQYRATTTIDGKELVKKGSFFVLPQQIEYKQTQANHALLQNISEQTGGVMVYPNELDSLLQHIQTNSNIVAVSHTKKERNNMLNMPLILLIILLAASAEWFLRKYYATY